MLLLGPISAWHDVVLNEFYFEKIAGFKSMISQGDGPGPGRYEYYFLTVNPEGAFDQQQPSVPIMFSF